ncbi:hypothetical protein D3C71_1271290 [compost metagenome]
MHDRQFLNLDQSRAGLGSHGQVAGRAGPQPRQRLGEPVRADRLEQVVDRLDVEGAGGIVGMRGDEDHGGCGFLAVQEIESRAGSQFDVQENGIRIVVPDQPASLFDSGGLAFDLDRGCGFKQPAQVAPRRGLIVDDQHA